LVLSVFEPDQLPAAKAQVQVDDPQPLIEMGEKIEPRGNIEVESRAR